MSIIKVHDRFFKPFITEQSLKIRIQELAGEITKVSAAQNPIFLAVLNGSFMFAADIMRNITFQSEISFVKLSSYEGSQSTHEVKSLIGLTEEVHGKHVIVLEDIIDTGLSMKYLLDQLKNYSPASIQIASLLVKPKAIKYPVTINFTGFEIENEFVLGYGMDYNGLGRNLPHLYVECNP